MKSARTKRPILTTTELLVLPDGHVLSHNLTPAVAKVLAKLNPSDVPMRQRAALFRSSRPKSRVVSSPSRFSHP